MCVCVCLPACLMCINVDKAVTEDRNIHSSLMNWCWFGSDWKINLVLILFTDQTEMTICQFIIFIVHCFLFYLQTRLSNQSVIVFLFSSRWCKWSWWRRQLSWSDLINRSSAGNLHLFFGLWGQQWSVCLNRAQVIPASCFFCCPNSYFFTCVYCCKSASKPPDFSCKLCTAIWQYSTPEPHQHTHSFT